MSYIFQGMLGFMDHNFNYWYKCYQFGIIVFFYLTFYVISKFKDILDMCIQETEFRESTFKNFGL